LLGGGAWNGGVELELELWQWRPELWRGESRGARQRTSEEECAVWEGEELSPLEGAGLGSGQRPASLAVCVAVDGRELPHSIGEKREARGSELGPLDPRKGKGNGEGAFHGPIPWRKQRGGPLWDPR